MFTSTPSLKRATAYQLKDREANQVRNMALSAQKRVVNSQIQEAASYIDLSKQVLSIRETPRQEYTSAKKSRAELCDSLGYEHFECKSRKEMLHILASLIYREPEPHLYMPADSIVRNYGLERWVESRQWPLTTLSASYLLYQLTQKEISHLEPNDLELLLQAYPSMFATLAELTVESVLSHIQQLIIQQSAHADILLYQADWMVLHNGAIYRQYSDSNTVIAHSHAQLEVVIVPTHKLVATTEQIDTIVSLTELLTPNTGEPSVLEVKTTPQRRVVLFVEEFTQLNQEDTLYRLDRCIDCGRCKQECPTLSLLGAYTMDYTPYHAALWPRSRGFGRYHSISFLCTDCGACDRVCPVEIPLSEIIRHNRFRAVAESHRSYKEGLIISGWRHFNRRQGIYSLHGVIKRIILLPIRAVFGIKRGYFRKIAYKPFGVWN